MLLRRILFLSAVFRCHSPALSSMGRVATEALSQIFFDRNLAFFPGFSIGDGRRSCTPFDVDFSPASKRGTRRALYQSRCQSKRC
ncbi:MAG: hypothetical protein A4E50_01818 [Methanosaeta sp. PtaB.Bin087]|nr:MAG: hypothetical protein A4E50_01818 [Methanosaeta sp. PtaB.Bin087]